MDKIDEDYYILDSILSQFIPFYKESATCSIKIINDLIDMTENLNNKKKKKNVFNYDNNIKIEEK